MRAGLASACLTAILLSSLYTLSLPFHEEVSTSGYSGLGRIVHVYDWEVTNVVFSGNVSYEFRSGNVTSLGAVVNGVGLGRVALNTVHAAGGVTLGLFEGNVSILLERTNRSLSISVLMRGYSGLHSKVAYVYYVDNTPHYFSRSMLGRTDVALTANIYVPKVYRAPPLEECPSLWGV